MMIDNSLLMKIGSGTQKEVFLHPNDPTKVIKVMRGDRAHIDGGIVNQNIFRRYFSLGIYKQFYREILQYFRLCKNNYTKKKFIFPMEIPFGFIHTNQGLGLVVERIIAPSGQSETLRDLCQQNKLEEKHIQALKAFFNECREYHLVFGEVNAAGIMYTEVRNNKPEFVLVDGIGDKLFIPLRAMSKTISAHYVRKVESRIKTRFGIDY